MLAFRQPPNFKKFVMQSQIAKQSETKKNHFGHETMPQSLYHLPLCIHNKSGKI
jgi:hypothetical protein